MPTASLVELLTATPADLDARFRAAPAGPVPDGAGRGVALLRPGTRLARPLAAWARTGWQGKTFDRDAARLRNRITPFGVLAIEAAVAEEASWVDGKPCIVLDYSKTSRIARPIRDEIREIAPGLYLGVVFLGRRRLPVHFALSFS
jgi:hypothetical protein